MGIGATVLPGLPLQALHDLQRLAGLAQPCPFQPERFPLAQSERERDDEPDPVALAQRQGQDALDQGQARGQAQNARGEPPRPGGCKWRV
jgi:hypothetical protein